MEATNSHQSAGAASTAVFVRDAQTISDDAARAKVRLATTLRDVLPQVEQKLCAGSTTLEHAAAAVAGTRGLDEAIVRASQPAICALTESASRRWCASSCASAPRRSTPSSGATPSGGRTHSAASAPTSRPHGLALHGNYGVEQGHEFLLGLDLAVESERCDGDARSLRQRRADVLLDWARQAAARHGAPAGSVAEDLRTARTSLIVTCSAEQLAEARRLLHAAAQPVARPLAPGSADDVAGPAWPYWAAPDEAPSDLGSRVRAGASFGPGALVSSAVLQRLTCDAAVSLAVLPDRPAGDPLSLRPDTTAGRRDPLYVGRAARIVTAAQWRALVVRDRQCVVKGCRRRPAECQAHHVRHWLLGGATDLDNLVLLCHQHHHDHHDRGHDLRHRDGRWMTSSGWGAQAPP
jgi:hypothetical protein